MSRVSILRQDDFTGGLNLRADQFQLTNNESPRLLNVEIDPRGGIFSRGAMRRINNVNIAAHWNPRSIEPFYADTDYLMVSTGRSGATNGNVLWTSSTTFNPLNISVTATGGASFAPWGSTLYMVGGVDTANAAKWDGTTETNLTANGGLVWQNDYQTPVGGHMPRADHCIVHAGKLFVANTYEDGVYYPNRVRWSHPNSPENWAELDRIDVTTGGDGITAIASFNGQLLIFKPHAVYALFGFDSDSFQVVEISRTVGASFPHCVATTEYGVYFFSYPDGLFFYNGQTMRDVFESIRPAITEGFVNTGASDEVYVSYINRRIWVSLPYDEQTTVSYPSVSFVLDPSIRANSSSSGSWTMFATADDRGVGPGCSWVRANSTTLHVAAHPTQAQMLSVDIYEQEQDNITGADISFESRYRTRWIDAGSYSQKKMFRRPDLVVKQVENDMNISVEIYGDYEEAEGSEIKSFTVFVPASSGGFVWGSSKWGESNWGSANSGSQVIGGRTIGLARSVQLEFSNVVAGFPQSQKWGISSYTLKYVPRKVKS